MLRYKQPLFSSGNTGAEGDLYFCSFRVPTGCEDGQSTPAIQAACDGFMVGKFERSFTKDLSNSLKTFINFATVLQND